MTLENENLLHETYTIFKQLVFYDYPIERSSHYLNENLMGYGTHVDEKILGIKSFNDVLKLQRDQSIGLDMKVGENPVFKKFLVNGNSAVFVEEILISMNVEGNAMSINCRLTTVLEYTDKKWLVVHFHGSLAAGNEGDEDTWSANELKEKNKELEKKVAERTEELRVSLENLKSTQNQLIHSEKMASLGELTAGIAHEIKNPLNFVNNFAEVSNELIDEMREEIENQNFEEVNEIASDIKQNLEKINHHGKRADAIVKGMLQHSRSSDGKKEPTDINALADEYLRLAYHGIRAKDKSFNATLKTDFDDSIGKVNIAAQDIGRVILNLITNAFYAVDEKKKSGAENYEPTVTVSSRKDAEKIEIKVIDNGNGIPEKVLNKIFQPFFTTKPTGQGTGLGLSLSYDIVKAHGGELKVLTYEGTGSSFEIKLPLTK
ncbi:ATP-binding protein [Lutimonas vermicola]|uniref:histidine kinase n=1 Tax=Lutimonas vermicola TaxID=414288 RepID=A0ABU9L1R3_9FLAO